MFQLSAGPVSIELETKPVTSCSSVEQTASEQTGTIEIYPRAANVVIVVNADNDLELQVTDSSGKLVYSGSIVPFEENSLGSFAPGIYTFTVIAESGWVEKKVETVE